MPIIGEKIAQLRKEKNMTQEALAAVIGVSAQSVSKWENSTTLPDIMLLPIIADVFEVSMDALFGRDKTSDRHVLYDELPGDCFDMLLRSIKAAFYEDTPVNHMQLQKETDEFKQALEEMPRSQSSVLSNKGSALYINSRLGLVFRQPQEGCLALLEHPGALDFIGALADAPFRTVLVYQMKNRGSGYTVSSAAAKCGLTAEETQEAVDLLVKYQFTQVQTIEMDGVSMKIYSEMSKTKMLLVYVICALAGQLSDYQEWYYCQYGCASDWLYR